MANNPYVNKVVFGDNTVMDISGDTATPSDVLKGETFHDRSGALQVGTLSLDEFATIDLLKDTVGWIGKNLFDKTLGTPSYEPNVEVIQTPNGVRGRTINANAWGSINYILKTLSNNTQYIFTDYANITSGRALVNIAGSYNNVDYTDIIESTGITTSDNQIVEFNTGDYNYIRIKLFITGGTGFENGDITYEYPMLRKADIADDTYEPYHESVEQCKFDRAEQRVLGAKNLFYLSDKVSGPQLATINADGSTIRISNETAATYQATHFLVPVVKNTNYKFISNIAYTSGVGKIQINETDDSANIVKSENYTTDGNVELLFNSGNRTSVRIKLFCTLDTSAVGNVTYNNSMLMLASDPDNTYVPYAMTNKELTDSLDGWTATAQVANEQVTFTGLDDTQGWGYDPRIWIDGNSTNLNPYCTINSITGAGTANMSITYDTDADNGAYVRLRIIK